MEGHRGLSQALARTLCDARCTLFPTADVHTEIPSSTKYFHDPAQIRACRYEKRKQAALEIESSVKQVIQLHLGMQELSSIRPFAGRDGCFDGEIYGFYIIGHGICLSFTQTRSFGRGHLGHQDRIIRASHWWGFASVLLQFLEQGRQDNIRCILQQLIDDFAYSTSANNR